MQIKNAKLAPGIKNAMKQMYHSFAMTNLQQPSAATIDLLKMPVTRKDTQQTVMLGSFLVSITAAQLGSTDGIPAVGVVAWGKGVNQKTFEALINALNRLSLFESTWKTTGLIYEWEPEKHIFWISAFPEELATAQMFSEINPDMKGVLESWLNHIVAPISKDDPITLMIIGVATTQECAAKIVVSTQKNLVPVISST